MKKIITALTFSCVFASAHAEQWLEAPTKIGGKIVLTNAPCKNYSSLRRSYTVYPSGKTEWGCWTLLNDNVSFVYDDGDSYTYSLQNFQVKGTPNKGSSNAL